MKRSKKFVAVLGCGPAGLLAALAARRLGYGVDIYSRKEPSPLYGAQYLHAEIPELTGQPHLVRYELRGTQEGYRRKVYGDRLATGEEVSPATLLGEHYAWDIREAYRKLWTLFYDDITNVPSITPADVTDLLARGTYKRVINSIPLGALCANTEQHAFISESVWASGDAPDLDRWAPFKTREFTVVCDGTEDVSWYRASNVFGHNTVEWAMDDRPPVDNVSSVRKPLRHNCTCHTGLFTVGRYGEWKKGVLAHEAYEKVVRKL